jgi:hypothetical protein
MLKLSLADQVVSYVEHSCPGGEPETSPDGPGSKVDDHDEQDGHHPLQQLLLC